jgi:hypothetical protein
MSLQRVAFSPLHTFTRATNETFFNRVVDSFGNVSYQLQTAPSGTAVQNAYDPATGEPLGLQVFEQRTNLLTYSEQFNNADWTVSTDGTVNIVPNATASPDGELTAELINSDATFALLRNTGQVTSGLTYSLSVFAKAKEYSSLQFTSRDFPNNTLALFNLSAETATAQGSGIGAKIESVGNGWYRCSVQFVATGTGSNRTQIVVPSTVGAGDRGIYLWGAMLETGAFPTPYIKTEATTATRNASVAVINDIDESEWWNPSEGTFVVEYELPTPFSSQPLSSSGVLWVHNDIAFRGISLRKKTTNTELSVIVRDAAGVNEVNIAVPDTSAKKFKVAFSFASSYAKASVNGSAVGSASGSVIDLSVLKKIQNGYQNAAGGAGYLNGTIAQILYYPTAVSDAKLQELSTL